MAWVLSALLSLSLLATTLQFQTSLSLTCSSQKFTKNRLYTNCNDLPHLASYLHWTYDSHKSSLALAFIAPPASPAGWIAWAINPNSTGMLGAQALIAFKDQDGSMTVNTYNLASYESINQTRDLIYHVSHKEAEFEAGEMRIFATVSLPADTQVINQVWQVGSSVANGQPSIHALKPDNLNSKGTLDLIKGQSDTSSRGGNSGLRNRNIHGILNAVSWGITLPIGIMLARYLRTFRIFHPAWFYLHASCQVSGYAVGVAGWATGLKLGSQTKGVQYTTHRYIGITLFCAATLQVFALFLRPKKDHKYRFYWNIYHHGLGYAIVVLGIINVFKGLEILDPDKKWRTAYVILLIALGVVALFLEAITWIVVLKRKSSSESKRAYNGISDSTNGRQQQQQQQQQPLTS